VRALWACLDALVAESVEAFSVQHRLHRPECPRFFPVADSLEGFQALLAESCMDGALRSHVAMVEGCQPFQENDDEEVINRIRRGLRGPEDPGQGPNRVVLEGIEGRSCGSTEQVLT